MAKNLIIQAKTKTPDLVFNLHMGWDGLVWLHSCLEEDSLAFGGESCMYEQAHCQTADDQANAKTDRLLTANVRKAIVGDKTVSTYAHNIKIITHDGHVTLKCRGKSEDEKKQVVTDAANAVPAENISNELTVKE
jgi:osmotically-inducible protein OsmY